MKKYILIGMLLITQILILIPLVKGKSWSFEDTAFLNPDLYENYHIEFEVGDKFYWSFTKYDEEFTVIFYSALPPLSEGKTSDKGTETITVGGIILFIVQNIDSKSGYIHIMFDINPPNIPGIVVGIAALIAIPLFILATVYLRKRQTKIITT
ncbi:MAG: hypothetical protein ACFFD7_01125 [Candidatus Thorarchaeota archaeon]